MLLWGRQREGLPLSMLPWLSQEQIVSLRYLQLLEFQRAFDDSVIFPCIAKAKSVARAQLFL